MPLPSGNNKPPISMADLNTEFGHGNSLSDYYGKRYYKTDNSRGYFQASGVIELDDFYSTSKTSPVVAGSVTLSSSQNYTIPMFNNLTVTVVGGRGGQGGINGNCAGAGGGYPGGGTYLADYVSVGGGSGGSPSGNLGTQPSASVSFAIDDNNQSSIIARYGQVKYAGVGGGGAGGATGYNTREQIFCNATNERGQCISLGTAYYCDSPSGGGGAGANGYIVVSWT